MHQRDKQRLFLLLYLIPSAVPSVTEKGCGDGYRWHARRQEQVPKSLAVKFTCRKPLLPLLLSGAYLQLSASPQDTLQPPSWEPACFPATACPPARLPRCPSSLYSHLSHQEHGSAPLPHGCRQVSGAKQQGSWALQVKTGDLVKEGRVDAGRIINAGPSEEESKGSSCFEWGLKEQC